MRFFLSLLMAVILITVATTTPLSPSTDMVNFASSVTWGVTSAAVVAAVCDAPVAYRPPYGYQWKPSGDITRRIRRCTSRKC